MRLLHCYIASYLTLLYNMLNHTFWPEHALPACLSLRRRLGSPLSPPLSPTPSLGQALLTAPAPPPPQAPLSRAHRPPPPPTSTPTPTPAALEAPLLLSSVYSPPDQAMAFSSG